MHAHISVMSSLPYITAIPINLCNNFMNNILFCGDPHGCFNNIISAVFKYRPKAIVLLGDYNLEVPLEQYLQTIIGMTKIYWIPGNHDFDSVSEYENLYHSALSYNSIHMKVIEIDGLRIAGLGSIFCGRIWMPGDIPKWIDKRHYMQHQPSNVKKIPLHLDNAIWHHEFEKMKNLRADILVTHEAPSCHRHGFKVIDELAEAIGAKKIFHGHHHRYYQDSVNGIAVTGVKIAGVCDLEGNMLA